jgi:hypothetical protein
VLHQLIRIPHGLSRFRNRLKRPAYLLNPADNVVRSAIEIPHNLLQFDQRRSHFKLNQPEEILYLPGGPPKLYEHGDHAAHQDKE